MSRGGFSLLSSDGQPKHTDTKTHTHTQTHIHTHTQTHTDTHTHTFGGAFRNKLNSNILRHLTASSGFNVEP